MVGARTDVITLGSVFSGRTRARSRAKAYGLGLSMRDVPDGSGARVYYHGGNDGWFAASVSLVPEQGFAVVVLFNETASDPAVVSQKALELVLGIREAGARV